MREPEHFRDAVERLDGCAVRWTRNDTTSGKPLRFWKPKCERRYMPPYSAGMEMQRIEMLNCERICTATEGN